MRRVKKNFSKKQFKPLALVVVLPLMGALFFFNFLIYFIFCENSNVK